MYLTLEQVKKHLLVDEDFKAEEITIPNKVDYSLSEPNVLLLDMAKYQVNGGAIHDKEEIMRIDSLVRTELKLDLRKYKVVQPWAVPNSPEKFNVWAISIPNSCI